MKNISRLYGSIERKLRRKLNIYPHKIGKPLRWGIIGLGNMAQVFADAINMTKDAILVAVASRSKEKASVFASNNHASYSYGSYEEMLADDSLHLDVVYIATPVKYHYEHIKLCLEAGKNVLCEKPICFDSWQLEELMRITKIRDCFLMEGMWTKCLPTFLKARDWVKEGKIGRLELIRANLYKRELVNPKLKIFNVGERGGVLYDYGVYALAFVQAFMGKPNVKSIGRRNSAYCVDSDWQILLEQNGIEAFVSLSSDFASSSKAALIGNEGTIEFESQFNRTNIVSLYAKDGNLIERSKFNYNSEGFEYEILHVGNMIREGKKQSDFCPLSDSLEVLGLMYQLINANE